MRTILKISLSATVLLGCSSKDVKQAKKDNGIIPITEEVITEGDAIARGDAQESMQKAFDANVFPLVRQYCAGCHSNVNPSGPEFAHEDSTQAFKVTMDAKKISLDAPSTSRLVVRLADSEHNCWSDCQENADEMEAAIIKIADAAKAAKDPSSFTGFGLETGTLKPSQAGEFDGTLDAAGDGRTVIVEAESGTKLSDDMLEGASDEASGGAFLYVNNDMLADARNNDLNDAGFTLELNVPETGLYTLCMRVKTPNMNDSDSVWIYLNDNAIQAMDNEPAGKWNQIAASADAFVWGAAPNRVQIDAGMQTFTINRREQRLEIDQFGITLDNECPIDQAPIGEQQTLGYDLSKALDLADGTVMFKVDITVLEDSYSFENPRIETSGPSIKIKSPKVIINGVSHPNYTGFDLVDTTVASPGGEPLESAGMVVAKEKMDPEEDDISFGFEILEVAP